MNMIQNSVKRYDCAVLTYDVPHRKTYDTLCLLKASGYKNVLVWAVPMHYNKKFHPLYEHRPPVNNRIHTDDLCRNFGYEYMFSDHGYSALPVDFETPVLICGAGIIPDEIRKNLTLINSHPGYIPLVRGLDALKWAIYEELPIGVTTHLIGDEVDAGYVIERKEVPVYCHDTFHALAQRVYETEILMLVDALTKIHDGTVYMPAGNNTLHKRMGAEIEKNLLKKFSLLTGSKGTFPETVLQFTEPSGKDMSNNSNGGAE